MAILIPIGVSVLGYVIYKLVEMGMDEFKEWAKSGGCPDGVVVAIKSADGTVHCYMYDPQNDCPPPTIFEGVSNAGNTLCLCPEPNVFFNGECLPPAGENFAYMTISQAMAQCPEGTTFQGIDDSGTIHCKCIEPTEWNGEKCIQPIFEATVDPSHGIQALPENQQCFLDAMAQGLTAPQAFAKCFPPQQQQVIPKNQIQEINCEEDEIKVTLPDGRIVCGKKEDLNVVTSYPYPVPSPLPTFREKLKRRQRMPSYPTYSDSHQENRIVPQYRTRF